MGEHIMGKLQWDKLLCEKRERPSDASNSAKSASDDTKKQLKVVTRNQFEADYDRIVGSSSVRRLQDKAQVFPLQQNDVVRTRLTHSMEVAAIARSLAKSVGLELEEKGIFTREQTEQLMGMLQTAGLIHDLGNPPFGHYGETAIRRWYEDTVMSSRSKEDKKAAKRILNGKKEGNIGKLSQKDTDFLLFDGNVQNLRIVTKLQTLNDEYGANFTYGTLATIIKYPYVSNDENCKKSKFGYFESENSVVQKIWKETGLDEGIRHPATYLLEAADDITYICDDVEDGVKKGCIPWHKEYTSLKEKFGEDDRYKKIFKKIDDKTALSRIDISENEKILAEVRLFRNYTQGHLIKTALESFFENYNAIMEGTFGLTELLEDDKELTKEIQNITRKYCYSCDEVLTLEVVGERVIKELLDIFYKAIVKEDSERIVKIKDGKEQELTQNYEGKIYHLISDNYKAIAKFDYDTHTTREFKDLDEYEKIHLIVDFVSGMTDSYAVSLYKKLVGINLPD